MKLSEVYYQLDSLMQFGFGNEVLLDVPDIKSLFKDPRVVIKPIILNIVFHTDGDFGVDHLDAVLTTNQCVVMRKYYSELCTAKLDAIKTLESLKSSIRSSRDYVYQQVIDLIDKCLQDIDEINTCYNKLYGNYDDSFIYFSDNPLYG